MADSGIAVVPAGTFDRPGGPVINDPTFGAPVAPVSDAGVDGNATSAGNSDTGSATPLHINITKYNGKAPSIDDALSGFGPGGAEKSAVKIDDALKDLDAAKIFATDTNDAILSKLGYSDPDIAKLHDDPLYKASAFTDGPNFLAKEIDQPGSMMEAINADPLVGGVAHGLSQTALQTARYVALGANKLGLAPDTAPAMIDAMSRVTEMAYNQARASQPQEPGPFGLDNDAIPQFVGSLALPMGAAGKAVKGVADATLAAKAAVPVATRLLKAGQAAIRTVSTGAVTAPMFDQAHDIKPRVGPAYNDDYADRVGEDAVWGAVWAAGAHTMIKGAMAVPGILNKVESASRIKAVLDTLRAGAGSTAQKYKDIVAKLEPMFKDPAYADREANFAANKVSATYGDVTRSPFVQKTEHTGRSLPFGVGNFRDKVQQGQVKAAAQRFNAEYYDKLIQTKWGSLKSLEDAAKGSGDYAKRAQEALRIIKEETGTDAANNLKADINAQQIRRLLIKAKLYAKRDALAGDAYVKPDKPLAVVKEALAKLSNSALVNRGLINELSTVGQDLENGPASQTYSRYVNTRNAVSDLVGKYGGNADRYLVNLKNAFDAALDDFHTGAAKYAKSERFGITAKNTEPWFSASRGGGYNFTGMVPEGAAVNNPEALIYADKGAAKTAGLTGNLEPREVKLRSPIIVEKGQGVEDFKQKLGLPENATDEQIAKAAIEYAKGTGHDGVVMTNNGTPRRIIDLTGWKRSVGDASNRATKFTKENFGPPVGQGGVMDSKQNIVAQALNAHPDQIVKQMLKEGQGDKAKTFFQSLGPRGKAAVRSQLIDDAIKAGTDEDGHIHPAKVLNSLFKLQDPNNVFFQGEDRWKLDGFLKLMAHAEEAAPKEGGGHFVSGLIVVDFIKNVAEGFMHGKLGEAVKHASYEAGALTFAGKAITATLTNEKVRHLLLAANSSKTPEALDKIYQNFKRELSFAAGAVGGSGRNDQGGEGE